MTSWLITPDQRFADAVQKGHGARSFPAMIDFAARVTAWFEEHVPR